MAQLFLITIIIDPNPGVAMISVVHSSPLADESESSSELTLLREIVWDPVVNSSSRVEFTRTVKMIEFMTKARVYFVSPNQYYCIIELDHWQASVKSYEYLELTAMPADYFYLYD